MADEDGSKRETEELGDHVDVNEKRVFEKGALVKIGSTDGMRRPAA